MAATSSPSATSSEVLSEYEIGLYDRQIRLWGVSAQSRLKAARVLICQVDSIHQEVAKNLIVAGVPVTFCDCRVVEPQHADGSFLISHDDIGKEIGASAVKLLQEMNRLVVVDSVEKGDWDQMLSGEEEKLEKILERFSVVVMPLDNQSVPISRIVEIDKVLRKLGKAAVYTIQACKYAFSVMTFPETFFTKVSNEEGEKTEITTTQILSQKFPSLENVIATDLEKVKVAKVDVVCLAFFLLIKYFMTGKTTEISFEDFSISFLKKVLLDPTIFAKALPKSRCSKNGGVEILTELWDLLTVQSSISGSTLGGAVTQEIRKYITLQEVPWMNCLSFNANQSSICLTKLGDCSDPIKISESSATVGDSKPIAESGDRDTELAEEEKPAKKPRLDEGAAIHTMDVDDE